MIARIAGLVLFAAGWCLRWWALRELRKVGIRTWCQLSISAPPIEYTEAGPYRFVRHPAYVGSMICFAGMGLMAFGTWSGAALCLPAWPHYVRRIVLEDDLRSKFEKAGGLERVAARMAG